MNNEFQYLEPLLGQTLCRQQLDTLMSDELILSVYTLPTERKMLPFVFLDCRNS